VRHRLGRLVCRAGVREVLGREAGAAKKEVAATPPDTVPVRDVLEIADRRRALSDCDRGRGTTLAE